MKTTSIATLVLLAGLNSFGIPQMSAGDFKENQEPPKKEYKIGESEAVIPSRFDEKYFTRAYILQIIYKNVN